MKSIIALAALLLTTSVSAQETAEKFAITYQLDGQESTAQAAGTVVGSISGSTATLTVTPAEGNYITKDQITVIKTIPGDNAQTRTPSVSSPVEITASSTTADPSGVTTYTFDASDANYRYEVKANFLSRKDVADALIQLLENELKYNGGEAIEPKISVTFNSEALTADKDYTVAYSNNTNAGQGVVTITGIGMYKGEKSGNFVIKQASVAIWFEKADGSEAKELETTFGTTFTEPVLKLDPAGVIEVTYSVNDESVATINPSTGKLTILKPGTVVVTAAAKENYTDKEGSNYEADPTSTQASYSLTINKATPTLAFSKETATATMGQAFTAPTLNNPNSLALTYSSSKETVATISEEGVVTIVGEGETTIKATFAGNETYEAAEASYTLTVSKDKATLAYSVQTATATMGQAFTAPTLSNPNNLAVTYSSSKETVATISEEGVVTIVGEGETVIKATFAGNDTYEAAEASYTLTVSKDKATLAYSTQTATATMGQAFTAPTLNNPNSLAVTYSSSKETVATISEEGVVTIVGEGETVIKATFAGNDTYEAAEASYTLTVSKDKATLAYSVETATATMGQAFTAPTLSNPNNLALTYSSSKETVATISEEGVVTLVGEGETVIKATFAGNDTYEAAEASYTLTVSKNKATLAFSAETATATMGQAFTAPTLNNPNSLALTYSSSKETVATISEEGVVTIVGEGETTIKATFAGNDTYEATEASYTLTVSKDKATLAYSVQTATATMGQAFTAPTLNNPNSLALTYSSSKETVATISEEGVVTLVGEGETVIKATFAGNETYEPVEASYTLTVSKNKATLAYSTQTATATMGQAFTAPTLSNPNNLAVTYSSSKETVATISEEGVVTLVGEGETVIKATFAGNDTYEAAEASYTLTVSKDKATLAYSVQTATATMGQAFTAPTLNNPNSLAVTYSSSKETVATISEEGIVTIVGEGETVIKATFAGNDTYEAAEASYTLTVSKDKATLAYSTQTATATMGQAFTAPTLNNPNNLAVTYSSSKETVATISEEGVVTIVGEGETTIKATFAGNDTYEAAEASYTLTVSKDKATLAYSTQTATATMGQAFTAPTLNNPNSLAVTYSSSKETVATISEEGVVTIVGEGETTIKATFAGNDTYEAAEASYTLTVSKDKATLAYSTQTATATMGQAFTAPTLSNPNNLALTYSSSKETVATISEEGVVTLVGEGETVIKATFAGNDTYEAAEASYTLTVSKDKATLAYSVQTATATMGQAFTAPTLSNPNNLAVTYSSSKETVATISEEGVVTIVGEGETVIKVTFAGNDTYEAAEASYTLTVSKDKATLAYSVQTATATMGQAFTAPTLNNPNNLAVTYSSSKETVATISEEGVVTLVGEGETVIKATFAGNDTYEFAEASYTLTVEKSVGEGYLLWVNDTQVTSVNAEDVLGHKTDSSKPYYIFYKDENKLTMDNDQTRTTVIESRMPELTVYIKDANKIKRIFFNNTGDASNKGNLTFTTNGNFPGKLIIANPTKGESAIKGFSNISYNWDLTAIEPDGSYYDTTTLKMMYKDETETPVIADTITIGEAIVPITEKRAITFEESQLVEKDEDGKVKKDESGNPIKANLSNYSYAPSSTTGEPEKNVIHISLNSANISDDAGGFDIENGVGGIYIEDTMTDEKAGQVAQDVNDNKMVPGGTLYSESYDGFTFKLIAGSGTIEIDEIVENTHEFHLIIGTNKPITLNEYNSIIRPYDGKSVRVQAEIAFNVGAPTYCFLYMVKKTAGTRGTRLGKRDKAHGKLVSVQVRSTTVIPTEPPSEATGGVIPKSDDPEPETDPTPPTPPTGITFVNSDKLAVKSGWYTVNGQKIAEPTQRGIYIKDGRKVVIK